MSKQQQVNQTPDKSTSSAVDSGASKESTSLAESSLSRNSPTITESIETRNERLRNDVFSNYSNSQGWPGAGSVGETSREVILVENQRRDQKGANNGLKVQAKDKADFDRELIAHLHSVFAGDSSSESKHDLSSQNTFQSKEALQAELEKALKEEGNIPLELKNNKLSNEQSNEELTERIEKTLSAFREKEISFDPENLEADLLGLKEALEKEGVKESYDIALEAIQQQLLEQVFSATQNTETSDSLSRAKRFTQAISLIPDEVHSMYPQLREELSVKILGSGPELKEELSALMTDLSKERGRLLGLQFREYEDEQRLTEIAENLGAVTSSYLVLEGSGTTAKDLKDRLLKYEKEARAETVSQNVYILARELALFEADKLTEASRRETDSTRGVLTSRVLEESRRNQRLQSYLESQNGFLSTTPLMAELTQRAYSSGMSAGFARREELSESVDSICKELNRWAWRADTKAIEQTLLAADAETLRIYAQAFEARTGNHFAQTINDRYGKNREIMSAYRLSGSKEAAIDLPLSLINNERGSVLSNQFETLLYEVHSQRTRTQAYQTLSGTLLEMDPSERSAFIQDYASSHGHPFKILSGVPNDEIAFTLASLMSSKEEEMRAFQITRQLHLEESNPIEVILDATRFLSIDEASSLLEGYRSINDGKSLLEDVVSLARSPGRIGEEKYGEDLSAALQRLSTESNFTTSSELEALRDIQLATLDKREREAIDKGDVLTTTAFLLDHALKSSNPVLNVHRITGGQDPRATESLMERYRELFDKEYVDPRTVVYQRSREDLTQRIRQQSESALSSSREVQNYKLEFAESRTGISGQLFTRWNRGHAEYYRAGIAQAEEDRKLKVEKVHAMRSDLETSAELFLQSRELEERARELQQKGKSKEAGELYEESQRAFIESLKVMEQTKLVTLTQGAQDTLKRQRAAIDDAIVWYDRTHAVLKTTQTLCYVAVTIGSGGTAGALLVTGSNVVEAGGHVAVGNKTAGQAARDGSKQAAYELVTSVGVTKAGMLVAGRGSALVFRGAPQGVTSGLIRTSVGGGMGSAGFGATMETANQLELAYHSVAGTEGYENFSLLGAGASIVGAGGAGFGYGLLGGGMSHVALNARSGVTAAFARHGDIGTSAGAGLLFDGPEGALSGALFARLGHLQARNHQVAQLKSGGYLPQSGPRESSFKLDGVVRTRAEAEVREASVRMRDDTRQAQIAQKEASQSLDAKTSVHQSDSRVDNARDPVREQHESAAAVKSRLEKQVAFNERLIDNGGVLRDGQKVDVEAVRAENTKVRTELQRVKENEAAVKTLLENGALSRSSQSSGRQSSEPEARITREEPASVERVRLEKEIEFNKKLIERGGTLKGGGKADLNVVRSEVTRLEARISEIDRVEAKSSMILSAATEKTAARVEKPSLDKAAAENSAGKRADAVESATDTRLRLERQVKFNDDLIGNGGVLKDGFKVDVEAVRAENARLKNEINKIDTNAAAVKSLFQNASESSPGRSTPKETVEAPRSQREETPFTERSRLENELDFNHRLLERGGVLDGGIKADRRMVLARNAEIEVRLSEIQRNELSSSARKESANDKGGSSESPSQAAERLYGDWTPADAQQSLPPRKQTLSRPESPSQAAQRLSNEWRPDDLNRPISSTRPNAPADFRPSGDSSPSSGGTPGTLTLERPTTALRPETRTPPSRTQSGPSSRQATPLPKTELAREVMLREETNSRTLRQVELMERKPDLIMQARLEALFRDVPAPVRAEVDPLVRAQSQVARPEPQVRQSVKLVAETRPQVETQTRLKAEPRIRLETQSIRPESATPRPERVGRRGLSGTGEPGDANIRGPKEYQNSIRESSIERARIEAEEFERNRRARFQTKEEVDENGLITGVSGKYIGEG